ncbi:hypothetical protein ACET3Z_000580 [Daucus carota]
MMVAWCLTEKPTPLMGLGFRFILKRWGLFVQQMNRSGIAGEEKPKLCMTKEVVEEHRALKRLQIASRLNPGFRVQRIPLHCRYS